MAVKNRRSPRGLVIRMVASATVLVFLINTELLAQTEPVTCPCFNVQEVEAIFAINAAIPAEQQNNECIAEDFRVEFAAEMTVLDDNWDPIARAHVKWLDFDPGTCEYINTTVDPPIERKVKWPHPAPEPIARACLEVIAEAIAKADTGGICDKYP
jgi:hypothetical protein